MIYIVHFKSTYRTQLNPEEERKEEGRKEERREGKREEGEGEGGLERETMRQLLMVTCYVM